MILLQKREPTPEGHRAPIADLFRHTQSVDTQTPFDYSDGYLSSNSSNSGSQSVSPAVPILLGQMDSSRPSSSGEWQTVTPPPHTHCSKLILKKNV